MIPEQGLDVLGMPPLFWGLKMSALMLPALSALSPCPCLLAQGSARSDLLADCFSADGVQRSRAFQALGESAFKTPLSQLSCSRKGCKKQPSPAPGDKVCLEKASTGARVWLQHQGRVLTPVALSQRLQHPEHNSPQPPARSSALQVPWKPWGKTVKGLKSHKAR